MKQCDCLPLLCPHTRIIFPPCLAQRGVNRLTRYMWEHLPPSNALPSPTPNGLQGNFIIYCYWRGLSIIIPLPPPHPPRLLPCGLDWIPGSSTRDNSSTHHVKGSEPALVTSWRQFANLVREGRECCAVMCRGGMESVTAMRSWHGCAFPLHPTARGVALSAQQSSSQNVKSLTSRVIFQIGA